MTWENLILFIGFLVFISVVVFNSVKFIHKITAHNKEDSSKEDLVALDNNELKLPESSSEIWEKQREYFRNIQYEQ